MAGVYLFAAVADDARPQSEKMSNMAMMVKKWSVERNTTNILYSK